MHHPFQRCPSVASFSKVSMQLLPNGSGPSHLKWRMVMILLSLMTVIFATEFKGRRPGIWNDLPKVTLYISWIFINRLERVKRGLIDFTSTLQMLTERC